MFHEHFPKGPCRFPYTHLITIQFVKLVPVNYSTFLFDIIPILGGHQEVLYGVSFLEVDLDSNIATNVLEAFTHIHGVGYQHIDVVMVVVVLDHGAAMSMVAVDLESV